MKNLFASLIVIGTLNVNAQLSEIDIHGTIAFPQNELKDNFNNQIYGGGISAVFNNPSNDFLEYGFGFNYAKTNSSKGELPIYVNNHATTGDIEVNSSEINTELMARLIPYQGTVQPYIEFNAGSNVYHTISEIKTNIGYYSEEDQLVNKTVSTSKDGMVDGMNFYLGWTAGSKFRLSDNFLIKASVNRTYTTQARYLDPNSVSISNKGFVTYDLKQSATSQLKTSLGLIYKF